jgi:hypothetical protein
MENLYLVSPQVLPKLPGCHQIQFVAHTQGLHWYLGLLSALVQGTMRLAHNHTVVAPRVQQLAEMQHLLFPATPGHLRIEMHDIHDRWISFNTA